VHIAWALLKAGRCHAAAWHKVRWTCVLARRRSLYMQRTVRRSAWRRGRPRVRRNGWKRTVTFKLFNQYRFCFHGLQCNVFHTV